MSISLSPGTILENIALTGRVEYSLLFGHIFNEIGQVDIKVKFIPDVRYAKNFKSIEKKVQVLVV